MPVQANGKPEEEIGFIVGPNIAANQAFFTRAPNLKIGERTWSTTRDSTAGARRSRAGAKPHSTWERFAQVLLFGNERIHLN